MNLPSSPGARNLLELDNARDLSREEVASTFVQTESFWRLIEPKNQIVLGSRGSGKTVLARMLAHDHLALAPDEQLRRLISDSKFIGVYVPFRLEWVSSLKNKPWQTDAEKEGFFQWRLNVATFLAFLSTARSCLDKYCQDEVTRFRTEQELAGSIAAVLFRLRENKPNIRNLGDLEKSVTEIGIAHEKTLTVARVRSIPAHEVKNGELAEEFHSELFAPLRYGIRELKRVLALSDSVYWLLALDEAEFLEPIHQRILNSQLRSYSDRLYFKITTFPYMHHTLETNTEVRLEEGQDFDYIYIDHDRAIEFDRTGAGAAPTSERKYADAFEFAEQLFKRRAEASEPELVNVGLRQLLGNSKILDAQSLSIESIDHFLSLVKAHCDAATQERAQRLSAEIREAPTLALKKKAEQRFKDSLWRKVRGAIALREEIRAAAGASKSTAYSGAEMAVRCTDGNPRRIVRVLNSLVRKGDWRRGPSRVISPAIQNEILVQFSQSQLQKARAEIEVGIGLFRFLNVIGQTLRFLLHAQPISTDVFSAVNFTEREFEKYQDIIKRAVGIGLLYPNYTPATRDRPPRYEGVFRLAYSLAPMFQLLPRQNRAKSLGALIRDHMTARMHASQGHLFDLRVAVPDMQKRELLLSSFDRILLRGE